MRNKIACKFFAAAMAGAMVFTSFPAAANLNPVKAATEGTLAENGDSYVYVYAGLTWNEYWASEGVYAAGNTSSSDEADTRGEFDKGGYDAVTRATTTHGLHRGSYQSIATIYDTDNNTYEVAYWNSGNEAVLTDGTTIGFNKGTITIGDKTATMDHYEVSGIKYVPVAVKASDYDAFKEKYSVVENGGTLAGGYSEQQLSAYKVTANVTKDTNGLKIAAKNEDGSFSFSARQTGTDSGVKDAAQKTAAPTVAIQPNNGSYGEFLRVDLKGDYGDLGANMQAVKWTYYGNDSTYTTPLANYGTKFAADNWMHKSNGIQLGLTDSIRCQLPEGYDGTGYWKVTVYALGYADYTFEIQATDENVVKPSVEEVDTTELAALVNTAKALSNKDYCQDKNWNDMLAELGEAEDELKDPHTQAVVDEAKEHLQQAINNLKKHSYKKEVTPATTSKDGKIVTKCSNCGAVSKEQTIKKIASVKLNKTSFTYNKKVQKPSVTVKDSAGKVITGSNYTVSYSSGSKNPGRYAVKVTFKGNYKGTVTNYYKIAPAKTTVKLSKAKKTSLKAAWKKVTGISGYQIQYGTSSKFKGAKTASATSKATSKTLTKLKKNKKYYVRVRSYKTVKVNGKNTKIYSSWSSAKKLKTKR